MVLPAADALVKASMDGVASVPVSMAALMATARILLCTLYFMINAPFHSVDFQKIRLLQSSFEL